MSSCNKKRKAKNSYCEGVFNVGLDEHLKRIYFFNAKQRKQANSNNDGDEFMERLDFYKKDGKWYADILMHTEEDNEMVFGADTLLEYISNGSDRVSIDISAEPFDGFDIKLTRMEHDDDGATYSISSVGNDAYKTCTTLWICNVTHDVFGEHPEQIYLKYKKKGNKSL